MKVSDIMTRKIIVIGVDETLITARRLFISDTFHHLIVVEHGTVCGVMSDRDLFKSISPFIGTGTERVRDTETLNQKVKHIMSKPPITLNQSASLRDAIQLFDTKRISCIPIVDDDKRPVGIISWRDIFHTIAHKT